MSTKLAVYSSVVSKGGKYGVVIHMTNGKVIFESDFQFDTVDEAKAAGTAILDKGMELMGKRGYKASRPPSPPRPVAATFVYVPSRADVEPGSQGLFVTEQTGPMPADLRIYTLGGFFELPSRVWKESPESAEWLFEVAKDGGFADLNNPTVFATLDSRNAALITAFMLRRETGNPWKDEHVY